MAYMGERRNACKDLVVKPAETSGRSRYTE
jgi:hypothetical protein